jgi:hypothetical protein
LAFVFYSFLSIHHWRQDVMTVRPLKAHVMRNRLLSALMFGVVTLHTHAQQPMCTREYMPVCGQSGEEIKTFPTRCVMQLQGGTWLSDGVCPSQAPSTSQEIVFTVAPDDVACVGIVPMRCLQVKMGEASTWSNFYDSIDGFTFQRGTTYQLLVRATPIRNPPADGGSTHYTLLRVISAQ